MALAAATFGPIGGGSTPAGAETTLPAATFVGTHPYAADQPTANGKALRDLQVHGGKVWAGYGDYNANTGPITLAGYDPTTGGFEAGFTSDTEAVLNLRNIGGELVAPSTDPRQRADFAISGPWRESRPLGATHVYDAATLNGADRWMVGSQGADAVAWRSIDGGTTWSESLRIGPSSGAVGDYARFYFAAIVGGKLYVQAVNAMSGPQAKANAFDGSTWSNAPSIVPVGSVGWAPIAFGGGVAFHSYGHGTLGNIFFFDGKRVRTIGAGYDVHVAAGSLWLLDGAGLIQRTSDLVNWATVGTAPSNARSLAVDAGTIYVGTTTAELWSLPASAGAYLNGRRVRR